jgi:hypothetical protein
MHRVLQEAASRGPVTSRSLRRADRRLRRRKLNKARRLFANPAPWDAVAGLGSVGLAVECVYAAVHPFAAGSVAGVASLATIASSGFVGGFIARTFGKSSKTGKDD